MSTCAKWISLLLFPVFGIMTLGCYASGVVDSVTLYTPYTKISVPPGESIDYSIDVINNSVRLQNVEISMYGMPRGWNYILKSGGWNIKQLSILPGEKKSLSLKVNVPLKINKGNYHFKVLAGKIYSLPLMVNVSEKGTFKTEFSTTQANMQGQANASFTFRADLKNVTADTQLYALRTQAPRGWTVTFKANYKQVTSVSIGPNTTSSVTVEIKPPDEVEAGTYKIPVSASTSETSADLDLEVVITGTYKMELSTPTGLLSTNITAGEKKRIDLIIKNTGSAELTGINLLASTPVNWDVTFDPKNIPQLDAGESTHVFATIKADKKAIPGDYVTDITAKTPETSSKASFRISVETSMLLGWIGVFIILIALGSVYYLFRKYGRR